MVVVEVSVGASCKLGRVCDVVEGKKSVQRKNKRMSVGGRYN
jgi:hypothetical protein